MFAQAYVGRIRIFLQRFQLESQQKGKGAPYQRIFARKTEIRLTAVLLQRKVNLTFSILASPEVRVGLSFHHLHHVNHLALLVCALFLWLLGAAWYSPVLFARPWMAALGITPGHAQKGLAQGMLASFLGDLLVAFILLHFILYSGADTFGLGAFVGFISWLGFFAAIQFPQGVYENRSFRLFAINGGYWLVGLLITGGVLAAWK